MPGRFSVASVFKAVDRMSAPVNRMENRVRKFTRSVRTGVDRASRSFRKLGTDIRSSVAIGAAGLVAMGALLIPIIGTTAKFERSLVSAAAKFPGMVQDGKIVAEQFKVIEDAALKFGATTEFSAVQVAESLDALARSGFTAKASVGLLPNVIDLATIAQIDLAEATRITTKSMGAFGVLEGTAAERTLNAAKTIDILAKSSTSASTTIDEMFQAIVQGAPVMKSAGASMQDTATMIALLADSGIDATRAGTALKRMALGITAPASEGAKAFRALKVKTSEFIDGVEKTRNVFDIFADMQVALKKLDPAKRNPILDALFGKIGIAAGINLINKSGKATEDMREKISAFTGTSKTMASVIRGDLQGSLDNMFSSFEALRISIGKAERGPIKAIIDGITKLTRVVIFAISENTLLGKVLLGVGVAAVAAVTAISTLTGVVVASKIAMFTYNGVLALIPASLLAGSSATTVATGTSLLYGTTIKSVTLGTKLMTAAQWLWNAALAANPIGLIVIALAAVIAIGIQVARNWDKLAEKWNNMSTAGKVFVAILGLASAPLVAVIFLVAQLVRAGQWLIDQWQWVSDFFGEFFRGFGLGFSVALDAALSWAGDFLGAFLSPIDTIKGAWGELWALLPAPVQDFLSFFKPLTDVLLAPFNALLNILDVVTESIDAVLKKFEVVQKIKGFASDVAEGAGEAFDFVKTGLGFGDEDEDQAAAPPIVSPAERNARKIDETRTTSTAELLVKAEPGTGAELNKTGRSPGISLKMDQSGAFA